MQEFDLQSLWKETDAKAEEWYQQLRPEMEQMARQQNASVLARLGRLMWTEIILGAILFAWVLIEFYRDDISIAAYASMSVAFLGACWVSYYYYKQFSKRIAAIPTMNVIASTQAYLQEVKQYRLRLTRLSLIVSPLAVLVGYLTGVMINSDIEVFYKPKFWIMTVAATAVFGALIYYGMRWYYQYFIGSREDELQALLDRLHDSTEEE